MHKRMRLALLAGQVDETRQSRFVNGFLQQAFSDDLDVCIFSMYRKYQSSLVREQAEMNIYNLFYPAIFDGIVILKDSIQTAPSSVPIEERIHETYTGPVLVIDRESDFFDNVFQDDYAGMSMVVNHMIKEHGYRDIAYISGRKGHMHSVSRLQAFRDTMKAAHIPVDEDRIIYGDYWYSSGEQAVRQLAEADRPLPDAIVCANDEMAIGVASELTAMGLKIPEDVAVAGFDTSVEGRLSPQSITSCDMPYEEMGRYAVKYIKDRLDGHNPGHFTAKPEFTPGETCGCTSPELKGYDPRRNEWATDRMNNSMYDVYNMMTKDIVTPSTLEEFFSTVYSYAYQIKDAENFSICLSSPWKDLEDTPSMAMKHNGYPPKMIRAMKYNSITNEGTVDLDDTFSTRYLLPELGEDREHPAAFCFTPFYCEDQCFGYAVISYGDKPVSHNEGYRRWMEYVSSGFELLRRTIAMNSYKNFIDNMKSNKFAVRLNPYDTLTDDEKRECEIVERILDENLITYAFQPIVKADTGEIFSYEALMRSTTEEPVSPLTIIKYAGFLGRMPDVEFATFRNVMTVLEEREEIFGDAKIFINSIPGVRVNDEQFATIDELLRRFSSRVVVEITEEAELDDSSLQRIKNHLSMYGIEIAIDDFGTGYSNINNLLRYMPNYVKIDRALLSGIDKAPQKQHFVQEIIKFCKDNNILSLAEGIETAEELSTVIHMGVDLIQGYYTARPALDTVRKIDKKVRNEIAIFAQEKDDGLQKQVYSAGSTNRVSLTLLAKYGCTDIIVGKEDAVYRNLSVIGAPNLKTEMHLKVLSGYNGEITLENVHFSNIKSRPCIEIEEGCDVVLIFKGNNILNGIGISVAPTSTLTTEGDGNLTIECNEPSYYAIGNTFDSPHGDIFFSHNGRLLIDGNGNEGICIGSGKGGNIEIRSGQYDIRCSGTRCVGIGSLTADNAVKIINCNLEMDLNSNMGVGIGSLEGGTDVYITKTSMRVLGSGNHLSGIGTVGTRLSVVTIFDANVEVSLRSNESTCLGSLEGPSELHSKNVGLKVENAGQSALAIGGVECNTKIDLCSTDIRVNVHNGLGRDTYAEDDDITILNGRVMFMVNDKSIDRHLEYTSWEDD